MCLLKCTLSLESEPLSILLPAKKKKRASDVTITDFVSRQNAWEKCTLSNFACEHVEYRVSGQMRSFLVMVLTRSITFPPGWTKIHMGSFKNQYNVPLWPHGFIMKWNKTNLMQNIDLQQEVHRKQA